MPEGIIRRHVDARVISYALCLLNDKELRPELTSAVRSCAQGAMMAGTGVAAAIYACRGASSSPLFFQRMNAKQREHFIAFFEALEQIIQEAWLGPLKEALETVMVLACETEDTAEGEIKSRGFAQGAGYDTRPLAVHEDDDVSDVDVLEPHTPLRRRVRKKRSRCSKEAYQKQRLENLVARALAGGVCTARAVMGNGQVYVFGDTMKGSTKLAKLRGSLSDGERLCREINGELARAAIDYTSSAHVDAI